jgi:NACHT domain/Restriction endonuclease/Pentapeptide repeats (8 copies)
MPTKEASSKSKKASSKKTTSKRISNGRAAVKKGRNFEDSVADLYRLLGAQVVQNIEMHQKKVDILATFRVPGSSREHRVIVECKDEKKAVNANQRVMAFKGLLDVARGAGTAESAEIVTRVSWSDQAKGFAKTSGIELFTYTEKISQLIDLNNYLKGLIDKFEKRDPGRPSEPPLGSYYVDLSAQRGIGDAAERILVIDTYIHQWLSKKGTDHQLTIFGEYGSGKSSLCHKLSHDLALSYLNDPNSSRIPILLNLREFIGKLDLEAYITSFLDRECRVINPRIELFRAMNDAGIFLLIFDGFDEMAVKVDADTLESNLLEIEKLAASPNSKVVLTSRPEYFISAREESEAITPGVNPFLNRSAKYEPLKILPWDEPQVEHFLQRRVPLVKGAAQPWTYYRDKIKGIGSLSDLSQRPVLLDMIVKTLPRLIASGEAINLPNLYKSYLIGEMKRQKVLKKRTFLLSDDDRLKLLRTLVIDIHKSTIASITFVDAQRCIERDIKPPKNELEAHTREFLTNSFLVRRGDEYHLSHKSILEYLIATKLNEEIQTDNPEIFGLRILEWQIRIFLKEFAPDTQILFRWIERTKDTSNDNGIWLGSNSASLICIISNDYLAGRDLSDTNLSYAFLAGADLRGTNLNNTLLRHAELGSARFFKKDIASAKIDDAVVSFYLPKSKKTGGNNVYKFYDYLIKAAKNDADFVSSNRWRGVRLASSLREDLLWEVALKIKDITDLEDLRRGVSTVLDTKVAIYSDECEQLVEELEALKERKKRMAPSK